MPARRAAALLKATLFGGGSLLLPGPALAQDTGVLAGVVLDDYTGAFVSGARIGLPHLGLESLTGPAGGFFLDQFPQGTHEVRFEAPGYVSVVEEIEVAGSEFLQVRLTPLTAVLDEILVLTGRPRRTGEPPGMPVKIDGAPWRSVLTLLEDQVPGVMVRRRGALGAGAAIWLRGVSSFQLSSAPDVYLDGVRIDSDSNPDALHALDVISADEVARIRVIKGAAGGAAWRGANGTIMIETHRGRAPRTSND